LRIAVAAERCNRNLIFPDLEIVVVMEIGDGR